MNGGDKNLRINAMDYFPPSWSFRNSGDIFFGFSFVLGPFPDNGSALNTAQTVLSFSVSPTLGRPTFPFHRMLEEKCSHLVFLF